MKKYLLSLLFLVFIGCDGGEVGSTDTTSPSSTPTSTSPTTSTPTSGSPSSTTTISHKNFSYSTVTSPHTSKVWLDRNLGASRVCTYLTDSQCYGDYYQWGREADGHEKKTSTSTTTLLGSIDEVSSKFVYIHKADWTSADSDGSTRSFIWSKIDGSSICPIGFRVPTKTELFNEFPDVSNRYNLYPNFLKVPSAGYRSNGTDDSIYGDTGTQAMIWSSEPDNSGYGHLMHFNNSKKELYIWFRTLGASVRCIKD